MNGTAEQYERQALEALAKADRWDNEDGKARDTYNHWGEQERRNALVYATLAHAAAIEAPQTDRGQATPVDARMMAAGIDFYAACCRIDPPPFEDANPLDSLATVLDLMADLPTEYPEEGVALETCKRLLVCLRAAVAKAEGRQ